MPVIQLTADYHPNGFPAAGLEPTTLRLNYRTTSTAPRLAAKLQAWEAARGNSDFELRTPGRTPVALAYELVNAYAGLRERYPAVSPEYLNLSEHFGDTTLATAWGYASQFPLMRSMGIEPGEHIDTIELSEHLDRAEIRKLRHEMRVTECGVRSPLSAGGIDMSDTFSTKKGYQGLVDFWVARNGAARAAGRPVRVPDLCTSPATMVLTHEFGHLVDSELCDMDQDAARHVYAALTFAVFGEWPNERQWRYNLWNYPTTSTSAGTHQGGPVRRHSNRQALKWEIGHALTRYAATSRDEAFAEAFALMYCGSPSQRIMLTPFRKSLREVGLLRRAGTHTR